LTIDAKRILAYSCLHMPYQHDKAFRFLRERKRDLKPTVVLCVGDLTDLHNFGRWPKNPNCYGPAEEVKYAKEGVRELIDIFPKQLVCWSNHDWRLAKHATNTGTPKDLAKTWQEVFNPPVGWQFKWRWELGSGVGIHGDRYSGKDGIRKAVADNFCSVIQGHIHTEGGVFHQEVDGGYVWGAQTGCLIDPEYDAFEYQQKNRNRPVNGLVEVIEDVPHFVPMY